MLALNWATVEKRLGLLGMLSLEWIWFPTHAYTVFLECCPLTLFHNIYFCPKKININPKRVQNRLMQWFLSGGLKPMNGAGNVCLNKQNQQKGHNVWKPQTRDQQHLYKVHFFTDTMGATERHWKNMDMLVSLTQCCFHMLIFFQSKYKSQD